MGVISRKDSQLGVKAELFEKQEHNISDSKEELAFKRKRTVNYNKHYGEVGRSEMKGIC